MGPALEENEEVCVGTINEYKDIKLKELELNKKYPIISFNFKDQKFENNIGKIIIKENEDLFEYTLLNNLNFIGNGQLKVQDVCILMVRFPYICHFKSSIKEVKKLNVVGKVINFDKNFLMSKSIIIKEI